jgi:hypothetical protein
MAEREAAIQMVGNQPVGKRVTLGGDRGYDTKGFAKACRESKITPDVAQHDWNRRSAIDGRTMHHEAMPSVSETQAR